MDTRYVRASSTAPTALVLTIKEDGSAVDLTGAVVSWVINGSGISGVVALDGPAGQITLTVPASLATAPGWTRGSLHVTGKRFQAKVWHDIVTVSLSGVTRIVRNGGLGILDPDDEWIVTSLGGETSIHPSVDITLEQLGDEILPDVIAALEGQAIPEAPEDGQEYVRKDGAWVVASEGGVTLPIDMSDVTGLETALAGKASSTHNHDGIYSLVTHHHDLDYADIDHGHEEYLSASGFVDPTAVTVSYDSAARTISLSGTYQAKWNGIDVAALQSFVSDPHPNTTGPWFLSYNGTSFVWSQTPWEFSQLQIAFVYFGAANKFGIRECHGLMDPHSHREFHSTIGTYLRSGGTLGAIVLNSTTAADRRPSVSSTVVEDEDLLTTVPALSAGSYTSVALSGAGATTTITTGLADIVPTSGNNIFWNEFTGGAWQQTSLAANQHMSVWLVAVPATADAASQAYRYLWVQGQSAGSLESQRSASFSSLNLGQLTEIATEFVPVARLILKNTGANWTVVQTDRVTTTRVAATSGGSVSATFWGGIQGTLTDQADLVTALAGKADTGHTHSYLSDAPSDGKTYGRKDGAWFEITLTGGTTSWGSITGTLSSQTDLQTALNGKASTTHDHAGVYAPASHTHDYLSDAPSDGKQYARKDEAWEEIVAPAASLSSTTTVLTEGQANTVASVTIVLAIQTSGASRVRLYASQADLNADASRPVEDEAPASCLCEATATSAQTIAARPAPTIQTGGNLWVNAEPDTTVTLHHLPLEA